MVFFISLGFLQWRKVQADLIQNSVGFIFHFFPAGVALSVHEAYWGLDEKPFENTPDPRFLYRSEDIEDLYTRLLHTLSSRHGAALIHIVSIFPLGSPVKLNNGEIGRVVATSRLHPTRPTIDVLIDPRGRRLPEPRQIDLQDEPILYIVDPAIEEGVLGGR